MVRIGTRSVSDEEAQLANQVFLHWPLCTKDQVGTLVMRTMPSVQLLLWAMLADVSYIHLNSRGYRRFCIVDTAIGRPLSEQPLICEHSTDIWTVPRLHRRFARGCTATWCPRGEFRSGGLHWRNWINWRNWYRHSGEGCTPFRDAAVCRGHEVKPLLVT
jgi:hypothetical protein